MEYNIPQLLDDRGIKYVNSGTHNVKVKCFSGMHEDMKPSLQINSTSGEFHCFVCHVKGNIISYLVDNKELEYSDVTNYIKTNFSKLGRKGEKEIFAELKSRVSRKKEEKLIEVIEPPTSPILRSRYLESRGFTETDIKKWNIRKIDIINDPYNGWIYVPVYMHGILRTYFLRSPRDNSKIYGYKYNETTGKNEGYPRKDLLFGYDNVKDFNAPVYVFEGIFDAIWFGKANKQSLALLGNTISKEQLQYLKKFKHVVLALDNDLPSLHIVRTGLALMHTPSQISIWRPPVGKKDANVCTMRELIEQTYKEISIRDFIETEEYMKWSLTNGAAKSNIRNS